jgi:hypothetical protein
MSRASYSNRGVKMLRETWQTCETGEREAYAGRTGVGLIRPTPVLILLKE